MNRLTMALLLAALTAFGAPSARADGDLCHVYVVDVAKARKAQEEYSDTPSEQTEKRALAAQVVFPEFYTTRGEEELTTKSYRFPGSGLYITASVFYTDESMASAAGADSMLLAAAVARAALREPLSAEENAGADLPPGGAAAARVKKSLRVGGRLYL